MHVKSAPALLDPYLPVLLDLNGLNLDPNLDLVPNNNSPCLQRLIPGQPEIPAIDLAARAESNSLATPRILRLTLELDVKGNRSGDITNRQIARELELLPISFDSGASEFDLGILLSVQKITRAKMLVPLVGAGIDAGCLESRLDRGILRRFLIDIDEALDVREPSLDGRDHQVLGGKLDNSVRWVELPRGLCSRRGSCLNWCGHRFLSNLVRLRQLCLYWV